MVGDSTEGVKMLFNARNDKTHKLAKNVILSGFSYSIYVANKWGNL